MDIEILNSTFRTLTSASAPLLLSPGGTITLDGYSKFQNSSNGFSILSNTLGTDVNIHLNDNSSIDTNVISMTGSVSLNVYINSGASSYSSTQTNVITGVRTFGANFIGNLSTALDGYVLSKSGVGGSSWIRLTSATIGSVNTAYVSDGYSNFFSKITDGYIDTNANIAITKLQQITTDTLVGRDTAGTGAMELITLNSTLAMNGSQVLGRAAISGDVTISAGSNTATVTGLTIAGQSQGSLIYYNGTSWVNLPPATDGYVLTTHSTGQNPTWASTPALTSAAPQDVTKSSALAGTSLFSARDDHKHNISTAAAVSVGNTNAEGTATSLARSDHTHTVTDLSITSQTQGSVIYFNGTNWVILSPSTDGYVLTTHGASANPTWTLVSGGGGTATDLSISGQAQGSVLYYNGSNWVQLSPGTDGYVLTTHGASANPTWASTAGVPLKYAFTNLNSNFTTDIIATLPIGYYNVVIELYIHTTGTSGSISASLQWTDKANFGHVVSTITDRGSIGLVVSNAASLPISVDGVHNVTHSVSGIGTAGSLQYDLRYTFTPQ
jgi:hypothetical protein